MRLTTTTTKMIKFRTAIFLVYELTDLKSVVFVIQKFFFLITYIPIRKGEGYICYNLIVVLSLIFLPFL